jgi:hypothetical protein
VSAAVVGAGIDTWSPCWWLDPTSAAARHLADVCSLRSGGGGLYPESIDGHRVGYYSSGLVWAEGHPGGDVLGRPADLPAALDRLELALLEAGLPLPIGRRGEDLYGDRHEGFAGIRRLDSTVDLATDSTPEGFAIMAGVAAVARDMPRSKANVWWSPQGQIQTVAMHGYAGGKLLSRVYDKGAESGLAAPGRLLRPEDQRRWDKGSRRGVEELTGHYVREKFVSRFAPLWRASKGVTVGGPIVLASKLALAVERDELSPSQARILAGHLVLDGIAPVGSSRTRRRLRSLCREHGLVLADGVIAEVEVDLANVMEAAMESDAWGASG